jgi:hypothetical protein
MPLVHLQLQHTHSASAAGSAANPVDIRVSSGDLTVVDPLIPGPDTVHPVVDDSAVEEDEAARTGSEVVVHQGTVWRPVHHSNRNFQRTIDEAASGSFGGRSVEKRWLPGISGSS